MGKFLFCLSACFSIVAMVTLVQAACPDERVYQVQCPAKASYASCGGTSGDPFCIGLYHEQAEYDDWGKVYSANMFVIERAGESKLCYTHFPCIYNETDDKCEPDYQSPTPHNRAINLDDNCGS
jgi:hypothetical protein